MKYCDKQSVEDELKLMAIIFVVGVDVIGAVIGASYFLSMYQILGGS